jgi:uncharacterized membrane protein
VAGEPETLDRDEPLARKVQRHDYDRLLMLSDGVFAIAITLLVLDVRPPAAWNGDLPGLIRSIWRALFGYGFGFAAVGGFWIAHRTLFARLRRIDGPATALALALLLFVGLVPAAAAFVSEHGPTKGIPAYLLLVAVIAGVQASLWIYAAFVGDLVDAAVSRRERKIRAMLLLVPFLIFGFLFGVGASNFAGWALVPILLAVAAARALRGRLPAQ